MSKIKIAYQNKLKTATLTSAQEDANNPLANICDDRLYDFFKSDGSATVTVDADLGAGATIDTFCLFKSNMIDVGADLLISYHDGAAYQRLFENLCPYALKPSNAGYAPTGLNAFGNDDTGVAGAGSFENTKRTADPFEEFNASFLQQDSATNIHKTRPAESTITAGDRVYASVYLKAAGHDFARVELSGSSGYALVQFDLTDGSVGLNFGINYTLNSYTITKHKDGWYHALLDVTTLTDTAVKLTAYMTATVSGSASFAGDNTSGIYCYGFQLTRISGQQFIPTAAGEGLAPLDTRPIMLTLPTTSSDRWRFVFSNASDVLSVGDMHISKSITTQVGVWQGFAPPALSREIDYNINVSDGGLPLGRTTRNAGYSGRLPIEFESASTMRTVLKPFFDHAEAGPFYFAWNKTDYPRDIVYAWTTGSPVSARNTHAQLMSVSLSIQGLTQ